MTTEEVCIALFAVGLLVALLLGVRGRRLAATRWAAAALLPLGAWLIGLAPVVRRLGRALRSWGDELVFDPRVWTGIGVLALSLVLFAAARIAGRRRAARTAPAAPPRAATAAPGRSPALGSGPAGGQQAPGREQPPKPAPKADPARKGDDDLGDFSEIEDILRRRGI
ncbi:hypothetical protein ACIQGZ_09980 [Streptomyces sp. NPDC092296]|uniref:hypothetical protein n=1 Tax=Streptomyces sp. NPDC092296 TaxID=3366012 RepID=UPI003813B6CB